MQPGLMSQYR